MNFRLILISHGKLAEGFKDAAELIIGEQDFIETYGLSEGEKPNDIIKNISFDKNENIIILSDIIGGSMHNEAVKLLKRDNVILIGGINLSLVIQIALTKPKNEDEINEQINESKSAFKLIKLLINNEEEFF